MLALDTSAWARVLDGRVSDVALARYRRLVLADEVAVTGPFRLEALYSARDPDDYVAMEAELDAFLQLESDAETWSLAHQGQADLARARTVSHRVKPNDLLLAAAAHQHGAGVLHYDRDYDVIAKHTRLDFESDWIARRGSID